MAKPATIAGHPIHPMLVVFPMALWTFSLVSDVIFVMRWGGVVWSEIAFYTMAGGLIGAVCAAIPGFMDYFTITDRRTAKTANTHMVLNLALVVLYSVNLFLRTQTSPGSAWVIGLSLVGIVLLVFSGWLGGDLVYIRGMQVKAVESPEAGDKDKRHARGGSQRLRSVR